MSESLTKPKHDWDVHSPQAKVASKVGDCKGMVAEPAVTGLVTAVNTGLQLAWTWGSPGAALSGHLLSDRRG